MLAHREISAVELLKDTQARIEAKNPVLNAIVSLDWQRAYDQAARTDQDRLANKPMGALAGLPFAVKDTEATKGILSTFGSPIHRTFIPQASTAMVERLTGAGVNIIGKTNVPEFGLGSHTFNTLFGATRNPWDISKSAGGSSGGAAASVTSGLLAFADGSDFGGSLRNPGSFNNLLGLRTSAGRVPRYPITDGFAGFTVNGPLARSADDAALLLSVMAGFDRRDPLSLSTSEGTFLPLKRRDFKGVKVAFSATLGGLPFETSVTEATRRAVARLESLGCIVEEAEPDLSGADTTFETLRALGMAAQFGALLKSRRHDFKDTAIWNIEQGLRLSTAEVAAALTARTRLYQNMRGFLERYRFLVAPVSQLAPFPVETSYPERIDGTPMQHYLEWMRSCTRITITAHPAMSVPGAFTPGGLPVGLQVVAPAQDELSLLQLARALEEVDDVAARRPTVPTAA